MAIAAMIGLSILRRREAAHATLCGDGYTGFGGLAEEGISG
ncbi:hypothetical protein N9A08_03680 [Arthrobacter koreensis]|uniref:Uncharacterized protein n=1 Tax=Arthrobacter koreensis TaxID=199136 RepID=A0ABY6FU83_9MICC|nr:hypothetical protein [Arthrobacter koreensis]UYB36786.1 hypothetical protein N9A08_03680 [Arthrobacter koreensis]